MSITPYVITNDQWFPITSPGKSGKCFLDFDNDDSEGTVDIRIFHTSGSPLDSDLTNSPKVFKPNDNVQYFKLDPDSPDDIYYARAFKSGDAGRIIVDQLEGLAVTPGSFDVNVQDQSSELLSLYLGEIKDTITVLSDILKNAISVNVETTGFVPVIGLFLCLQEDTKITQFEIISVTPIAGDQYTLGFSIPSDYPFTIASGCTILDVNMNKDGSLTPIEFQIRPKAGTRWDITRMMTSMVLSSQGDDGLFGNLPALSRGVYFRKEDGDNSNNIFNSKENSDFAIEGFDVAFPVRSGGGGSHGMRSRITWGGQSKQGVVIRLDGDNQDYFAATVRDDLTGLNRYRTKIQGHVVEDQ